MKVKIIDAELESKESVEMPPQFDEDVSQDLIARAFNSLSLSLRQPYGAKKSAGTRVSAKVSRRRRQYRGSYGKGISRVPRKILSRRGSQMFWQGALAPGTVGGRRAHPPKSTKLVIKKINKKENSKAIRSALAATLSKELVELRGHKLPEKYPFAITDSFTKIDKTKQVKEALVKMGFTKELSRTQKPSIRAGKGKMRGRKYIKKTGPLFVVAGKCALEKSAANIPGLEIVEVRNLNTMLLAPGSTPGRLTIFTKSALEKMKKDKLFM